VFTNSSKQLPKPCKPAERPPLLAIYLPDKVRERIRCKHDSIRTEPGYVHWVRRFIRFDGLRHSRGMAAAGRRGSA